MAHVLAEAPAPPVRAPTPAPVQKPRVYEAPPRHAVDALLEQRLNLDARRKSALDKREALIIRALAAVKRREAAVAERERRLDARTEALDRRERLIRAREDSEARRAKRLEDANFREDPRLPEIAKRLEAVEKLVDETAEVVSPEKPEWRQRAKRRAATEKSFDTSQSRQKQVEAYHNKKAYLKKSGRPRTAPPKKGREPPHLDDMAVAREICRSLDVLSRETGESREAWRTKIFGASPPPKRQVSVTMPVASAPFAVAETCRQAVMSVDSLPGGPQAPRDVDRARLEETLRGRLRRARM